MSDRTITADATGRSESIPDLATVEVVVTGEGDTATAARTVAADRATTVRESLAVPADRIGTVDLTVEDADDPFAPDIDAAFRATERLHVECVPETVESVVLDVSGVGGSVASVEFHVHADVHRRLQDEALADAMERARAKAERMAAVEGLAVDDVREVTTCETGTGMDGIVDQALSGCGSDVDIDPSPVVATERVEVVYELVA